MRRKTFFSRMLCLVCGLSLATLTAHAQLVFKVSSDSLAKPSYIVGTMHLVSATFASQITGATEAINKTEQVIGELDIKKMNSEGFTARTQKAMLLPDGKTIKDVLTAEQLAKVNTLLTNTMGTNFKNPKMMEQMGRLSPAALANAVSAVLYIMRHAGSYNPDALIDFYFQQVAEANQEPTGGLETGDEQLALLYGQPMDSQVKQLLCLCDNSEAVSQSMEDMVTAYMNQDLAALGKVFEDQLNNGCDVNPENRALLIADRNRKWTEKMAAIMAEKPTLFVVGVGHFTGEDNLLDMLRKQGYTVEAVVE